MRCLRLTYTALIAVAITTPIAASQANDSSSELAAGGLVLVKTDAIAMQREDLTLSPGEVHVRYEMRNDQRKAVTLRVAFPMPEVPVDAPAGMEIADAAGKTLAHNIAMPDYDPPNFMGFGVSVDGQTIEPDVEIRADLPNGRNIVNDLRDIGGWSLVLHPRTYDNDPSPRSISDRDIGPSMVRQLRALGAVDGDDAAGTPIWKTRITFHWLQIFKPGVTIVEHDYRPILGHFMFRRDNGKWRGAADGDPDKFEATYCIDAAKGKAMQEMIAPARDGYLSASTLGYVLSTGANWAGPIGTFHLTVDGRKTEWFDSEVQMMSLCAEMPLHRTGPLLLEATVRNYVPKTDLKVLIVTE
jgi:Domain of unknown function (DUF4424)